MSTRPSPSTVTNLRPRTGRTTELLLLIFALLIVGLAYVNVSLATTGELPVNLWWHIGIYGSLVLGLHLVLRWRARFADPLLLPLASVLNGLGLVMIFRIDSATGAGSTSGVANRQLLWTTLSILIAAAVLIVLRDHRTLRRYTYIAMASGFVLLMLPMLPVIGQEIQGSRLWINIAGYSVQPGEFAKIAIAIFFAGYLVSTRDALSLVGKRFLGLQLPRARDLGPILVAWGLSVAVLVLQRDLGSSLLFFGLFVAMLYVATERTSWIIIGLSLFVGGALLAWQLFDHVQRRVTLWLDPFAAGQSDQVAKGLMGMAHGGLFGTGLGEGFPYITYLANSDYIFGSFAEELGLIGVFALLLLYLLLVQRGLRTAIGAREGFGKLLAAGLAFTIALQIFVIIGGITRVIPLTGLTTPFLSAGGSSLLANWIVVALLLRISDHARRPVSERRQDPTKDLVHPRTGGEGR